MLNDTLALITWRSPPKRELHGELKGFKILIDCDNIYGDMKNETSSFPSFENPQLNFTLNSDAHSLTFDISMNVTYAVQVAAYNRQGMGPFSTKKELKVKFSWENIYF